MNKENLKDSKIIHYCILCEGGDDKGEYVEICAKCFKSLEKQEIRFVEKTVYLTKQLAIYEKTV